MLFASDHMWPESDFFFQTHYSDGLCQIHHLNMTMESIYLSD